MKKYIATMALAVFIVFTPFYYVQAAAMNQTQYDDLLKQMIALLEQELNLLLAQQQTTTPATTAQPASQASTVPQGTSNTASSTNTSSVATQTTSTPVAPSVTIFGSGTASLKNGEGDFVLSLMTTANGADAYIPVSGLDMTLGNPNQQSWSYVDPNSVVSGNCSQSNGTIHVLEDQTCTIQVEDIVASSTVPAAAYYYGEINSVNYTVGTSTTVMNASVYTGDTNSVSL